MDKPIAIIIEDEGDLADIYARAVRAAGFETETALGGEAASTRLSTLRPDLVVLDLYLPTVSGVDILWQIRADARLANVPVIIATADNILAESLRKDVQSVLIKPISFAELRNEAARFLRQRVSQ